ncbi:MAG: Hsp20/alpha crystallin family protein [Clostridia bacterium]|nr:Hsp20/alpha crystallin family protein [Clostridia bacterium]
MRTLVNRNVNPFGFFNDTFDSLFRPFYTERNLDFMRTDISETEDGYKMEVELPGFDKKDISVEFDNKYLTIRATRNAQADDARVIRKERHVSMERSYYVGDIDDVNIVAKYDSGILAINLPKKVASTPEKRGIEIK